MALPNNTGQIIQFMYGVAQTANVEIGRIPVEIIIWDSALGTQPTEQEIIDAGNDLTTVNGQVFSVWLAEHGGDPALTFRRLAKEALDKQTAKIEGLIRAMLLVVLDEMNLHADKMNEINASVDAASNFNAFKSDLQSVADYPQRTPAQLRNAIKSKLDAGDADN
jgi:hypothetical protein